MGEERYDMELDRRWKYHESCLVTKMSVSSSMIAATEHTSFSMFTRTS